MIQNIAFGHFGDNQLPGNGDRPIHARAASTAPLCGSEKGHVDYAGYNCPACIAQIRAMTLADQLAWMRAGFVREYPTLADEDILIVVNNRIDTESHGMWIVSPDGTFKRPGSRVA